jgi:hypothetical protein
VNRRRWLALGVTALVPIALTLGFGHRGAHMARSILVPGAGLYDERLAAGLALTALAVVATIAWLRWGVDWSLAAVIVLAVVVSGLLAEDAHPAAELQQAAHEFPLVVLVLGALGWARSLVRRVPLVNRIRLRPRQRALPPVDRCRAAAIAALAGAPVDLATIEAPDVAARARRIGLVARGRRGGDPFRVDHAHARAALALTGRLDDEQLARFRSDAAASWAGVPCSEPGWVRLLDGTLAALATGDAVRWRELLDGSLQLRRGHRPAWVWTPLGIAAARADEWEHAAATALARANHWIGDADWIAIRQRALGAAARGTANRADERLIAAARIWVALVDDEVAARVLARPTVRHDGVAIALDAFAHRTAAERIAA